MKADNYRVYFIGAGPGDPELITVKGMKKLESAKIVLYTGSLIPKKVLKWVPDDSLIVSSEKMNYGEIFQFYKEKIKEADIVRLHTGDPSLYSTIAIQIAFLKENKISYEVIPGVSAAFGAASSLNIEYTIPGVSQSLIISRLEGRTPNPEDITKLLSCKDSSIVLYLSASLIDKMVSKALELNYSPDTPCWVVEKATWPEEKVVKSTLAKIENDVKEAKIEKTALILLGNFLNQKQLCESHLYNSI